MADRALFESGRASCRDLPCVVEARAGRSRGELSRAIERTQAMPGSGMAPDEVDPLLQEIGNPDPGPRGL